MRIKVLDVLSFVLLINRQFYEVGFWLCPSECTQWFIYLWLLGLKAAEKQGRCLHLWSSGLGPTQTMSF